jgi:hypothetical protein
MVLWDPGPSPSWNLALILTLLIKKNKEDNPKPLRLKRYLLDEFSGFCDCLRFLLLKNCFKALLGSRMFIPDPTVTRKRGGGTVVPFSVKPELLYFEGTEKTWCC